jgi:hypothetical protein
VWTPRRILLLVVGAGLFTAAFLLYNRFLGWIDGLPTLPERYLAAAKPGDPPIEPQGSDVKDRMLRQAFGDACREVGYNYRFLLQSQGLVLAFERYSEPVDGRIKLEPLSIAAFGKFNTTTQFWEINTVHCDVAWIEFDHPVATLAEAMKSKLAAADFLCKPAQPGEDPHFIHVRHNHSTPQANDDMIVKLPGPLHFEDNVARTPDKPQLWTDNGIDVTDYQVTPPHMIKADTFRLYLEPDALKTGGKRSPERTSAVRRIELGKPNMQLTVEGSSDFLAYEGNAPAAGSKPRLFINTQGTFQYDLSTNRAEFTAGERATNLPQYVEVIRNQPVGLDELRCDRLQLQFQPKTPTVPAQPGPTASSGSLALSEVRATGPKVVLISATEKLHACGTELIFRQEKREAVLRGSPMSAIKEGNRIEAPELYLHRPDPNRPAAAPLTRLARAPGPGTIYLRDGAAQRTIEVRWRDELLMEREGGRDRITLTGQPVFDDRENSQWLRGDQIRIWMLPTPATASGPPTGDMSHARPERMLVSGRVDAQSPDLVIHDTPLLEVLIRDVERPLRVTGNPIAAPIQTGPPPGIQGAPSAPPSVGATPQATKKPVFLSADFVQTTLLRHDQQMERDHVRCEKRVHVRQEGANPKERGLEIRAQTLDLAHHAEGDVLTLSGGGTQAHVEVQELTLEGPEIIVDQLDNCADVNGKGLAVIQTASQFNGERLDKPTDVVIRWGGRMKFEGNRVSFYGGVQADQEALRVKDAQKEKEVNRLLCPRMDVYLDRAVSFSQWHRERTVAARGSAEDRPQIKRVVCHRGEADPAKLVIVAGTLWRNGELVRFHRIDAPEVTFANDTAEITATCVDKIQGEMRLFQLGGDSLLDDSPKTSPAPSAEQHFNLTRVQFRKQMRANNRTQIINFSGTVRVWHAPTEDPNMQIDVDHLPQGAFTLTCQELEVGSRTALGKRYATMIAEGKADIFANDFSGRADTIKYDESKKQQVIFDSSEGNPAALYHIKEKGKPPMEVLGKQIIYYRDGNQFRGSGLVGATGAK